MVYLFLMSIIPTVPGAWLTFAEGAVYKAYDTPFRLCGISVTADQQAAGLIMKLVGGGFLWVVIAVLFFRWAKHFEDGDRAVDQVAAPQELTWESVEAEFEKHPAPAEPVEQ